MAIQHNITKYALFYYGKRSRDTQSIALIYLYNDSNQYIGNVQFYRDGQPIPYNDSTTYHDLTRVYLRMHERQLDSVVDMLRNEKPCTLLWANDSYAYLSTGTEPVGEEET